MSVVATGHRTHRPSAWAWLAQAWAGFRPRMGQETLALLTGLLVTVFFNTAFFRAAHATGALHGFGGLATGACLFVFVAALNTLLALLLFNRWSTRPVLALLLPVTAAAAFYMDHYGVYFDTDMVRNVLQTDARESTELLSFGLVAHVVLAGMLPAALAWRIELLRRRPARAMLVRAGAIVLAILVAAGAALLSFQSLSALMRNHHQIRHLITPGNYLVSLGRVLADEGTARDAPRKTLGAGAHVTDAQPDRRPRLLVLVVGETVRAQNWGLNGYVRQTTPQLAELDGINYPDVTACGTNTEVSLPCMFSPQGLRDYDRKAINQSQSLLHVLDRVGVKTLWRDNQSGCKGVCSDLPFESFQHAVIPVHCEGDRCLDSVLLDGLKKRIDATPGDVVVVLHMLGNHGPAYFRRYPPEFRRFTPTCDTDQLAECEVNAIVNSYDNSVLYTDEVLAQAVALLKQESATHDTALLYLSDHGESLGEAGLYLHGVPRSIAPDTQLKVPMWLWLSPELRQADGIDMACADAGRKAPRTHDAMFSTVLGLMRVRTNVYAPEQDLFNGCRATKPAAQASAQ